MLKAKAAVDVGASAAAEQGSASMCGAFPLQCDPLRKFYIKSGPESTSFLLAERRG